MSATADGADGLAVIDPDGTFTALETPFTLVSQVVAGPAGPEAPAAVVVAGSPVSETAPYGMDLATATVALRELRPLATWASGPSGSPARST
ncbi:MAG: hypothetical protein R2746_10035 [Acidimicrobiales bacterium]